MAVVLPAALDTTVITRVAEPVLKPSGNEPPVTGGGGATTVTVGCGSALVDDVGTSTGRVPAGAVVCAAEVDVDRPVAEGDSEDVADGAALDEADGEPPAEVESITGMDVAAAAAVVGALPGVPGTADVPILATITAQPATAAAAATVDRRRPTLM